MVPTNKKGKLRNKIIFFHKKCKKLDYLD